MLERGRPMIHFRECCQAKIRRVPRARSLNYVSASPYGVSIAKLAAAEAAIPQHKGHEEMM
jgi:hypothetical protein